MKWEFVRLDSLFMKDRETGVFGETRGASESRFYNPRTKAKLELVHPDKGYLWIAELFFKNPERFNELFRPEEYAGWFIVKIHYETLEIVKSSGAEWKKVIEDRKAYLRSKETWRRISAEADEYFEVLPQKGFTWTPYGPENSWDDE